MAKGALRRALAVPIPADLFGPLRVGAAAPLTQNQDDEEGGA